MQRPIANSAIECGQLFNEFSSLLHDAQCERRSALKQAAVEDQAGRYRIWAGNLGALQRLSLTSSLDHRLRESPKVAIQIQDLLNDLKDALRNAMAIASGERGNRQYASDDNYTGEEEDEGDRDERLRNRVTEDNPEIQTPHLSEAEELFESVKETITSLFRIAMLIRKASPRDRFARALASKQITFDESYDISHVGHKFPFLAKPENMWLKERLGKAITQRRQYLRYTRDHREKLDRVDPELGELQVNIKPTTPALTVEWAQKSQAGKTDTTKPTSALASTLASTLRLGEGELLETNFEDGQSQTSYALSLGEESDENHQLPPLSEIAKGAITFECPLCWTIQNVRKESSWRKHAFSDLRPYVCTFEKCDVKIFSDRHEWFHHEFRCHRAQWLCNFCQSHNFKSMELFKRHLQSQHAQGMTNDQLDALLDAGRQPIKHLAASDCPICGHEWEKKLRLANPEISEEEMVIVTPAQYRRHVGSHMEQLALFALPRGYLEDDANAGSKTSVAAAGTIHTADRSRLSSLPNTDTDSQAASFPRKQARLTSTEMSYQYQLVLDSREYGKPLMETLRTRLHDLKPWIYHIRLYSIITKVVRILAFFSESSTEYAFHWGSGQITVKHGTGRVTISPLYAEEDIQTQHKSDGRDLFRVALAAVCYSIRAENAYKPSQQKVSPREITDLTMEEVAFIQNLFQRRKFRSNFRPQIAAWTPPMDWRPAGFQWILPWITKKTAKRSQPIHAQEDRFHLRQKLEKCSSSAERLEVAASYFRTYPSEFINSDTSFDSLYFAAERGDLPLAKYLIMQGASPRTEMASGNTIFEVAINRSQEEFVAFLLKARVGVDLTSLESTQELVDQVSILAGVYGPEVKQRIRELLYQFDKIHGTRLVYDLTGPLSKAKIGGNFYSDLRIANETSQWLFGKNVLGNAVVDPQLPKVSRINSSIESMTQPPIAVRKSKNGYLGIRAVVSILQNELIGEITGRIGRREEYTSDPINRWDMLHHPRRSTFFPPYLPIYIDSTTIPGHIRRSCNANTEMKILAHDTTNRFHFCLVAKREILAGVELTLGWDFDEDVRQRLEMTIRKAVVPMSDHEFIRTAIETVLGEFGECPCDRGLECVLQQAIRAPSEPDVAEDEPAPENYLDWEFFDEDILARVQNCHGNDKSIADIVEVLKNIPDKNTAHDFLNSPICIQGEDFALLNEAAKNGDVRLARVLVEYGANVNIRTADGRSPLSTAVNHDHLSFVEFLFDKNVQVEVLDVGDSMLQAFKERIRIKKQRGLDWFQILQSLSQTPDNISLVEEILKTAPDSAFTAALSTPRGATGLHYAASQKNHALARLLLENGAHSNPPNRNGIEISSPLTLAVQLHDAEMFNLLLEHGADPRKVPIELWGGAEGLMTEIGRHGEWFDIMESFENREYEATEPKDRSSSYAQRQIQDSDEA